MAFDIDGVLADFVSAYQRLFVLTTGRDLFHCGDIDNPPVWDWPTLRGYTDEETVAVWNVIKHDSVFWMNLAAIEDNMNTLRLLIKDLEQRHEIYYVTSRLGDRPKRQTELWLAGWLRYPLNMSGCYPTVLISGAKGDVAKALKLDVYIDDNFDNVQAVAEKSPHTRTYLLTRRYNELPLLNELVVRVDTLGQMFDHELGNL